MYEESKLLKCEVSLFKVRRRRKLHMRLNDKTTEVAELGLAATLDSSLNERD